MNKSFASLGGDGIRVVQQERRQTHDLLRLVVYERNFRVALS